MNNHTPAPWTATETAISDSTGPIATTFVNTKQRYIGKKEAEANAKLIAAAPELLEAAKMALNAYGLTQPDNWRAVYEKLQDTILKAETV